MINLGCYAYPDRGKAYVNKGELDKAITDFTEVIRLYPKDYEAYGAALRCLSQKGRMGKGHFRFLSRNRSLFGR